MSREEDIGFDGEQPGITEDNTDHGREHYIMMEWCGFKADNAMAVQNLVDVRAADGESRPRTSSPIHRQRPRNPEPDLHLGLTHRAPVLTSLTHRAPVLTIRAHRAPVLTIRAQRAPVLTSRAHRALTPVLIPAQSLTHRALVLTSRAHRALTPVLIPAQSLTHRALVLTSRAHRALTPAPALTQSLTRPALTPVPTRRLPATRQRPATRRRQAIMVGGSSSKAEAEKLCLGKPGTVVPTLIPRSSA